VIKNLEKNLVLAFLGKKHFKNSKNHTPKKKKKKTMEPKLS
jgi:hypothetical protein